MGLISAFITLACGLSQFVVRLKYKIYILIIGVLCLDCFSFGSFAISKFRYFVCLCFFISELKNFKSIISNLKRTRIIFLIKIIIIGAVICLITSPHLRSVNAISSFVVKELIAKYFVICYGLIAIYNKFVIKDYIRLSGICLIILTFFGIQNLIFSHSLWVDLFSTEELADAVIDDRLRLSSMFIYTFDYGEACIILLLTFLYAMQKKLYPRNYCIFFMILAFWGLVMSGSRSVLATGILSVMVYFAVKNGVKDNIKLFIKAGVVILAIILLIPAVSEKLEFLMSAVDTSSTVAGSSAGMRIGQYLTVFYIVQASPIFGMGYQYFFYDLGWGLGLGAAYTVYPELCGLEGALMGIILERGIVGTLVYLIFYIGLIRSAMKLRSYAPEASAAATAIITSFVLYGNMTGELNSAVITLLYAGFFLAIGYNEKKLKPNE